MIADISRWKRIDSSVLPGFNSRRWQSLAIVVVTMMIIEIPLVQLKAEQYKATRKE